jgi:hypothetical protein
MRRRRRQLTILSVLAPVVAGLALISLRGSASSASTVAPSARPTATAFVHAYVSFLNGRTAAWALPDATATTRALASSSGRVPVADQGAVVLRSVRFSGVLGATSANARLVASAGARTLYADMALAYAGDGWLVTDLVPPDFSTVFSPPAPPIRVPPAARAAAEAFAVAYADYRTGRRTQPPSGLPTITGQIAARKDPLAGAAPAGAIANLVRLQLLPQGQTTAVDAVLAAGGRRLAFGFLLEYVDGRWQAWQFPVSVP